MSMFQLFQRAVRKIFNIKRLEDVIQGDIAENTDMYKAIYLWGLMYQNKAPWVNGNIKSMNLPATIAAYFAQMITLEMKVNITGDARAQYIADIYKTIMDKLRVHVEYGCAKGGIIFKPYLDNTGNIAVDFVQADQFFPTVFDANGRITGVVFLQRITKGDYLFTRVEEHSLKDNTLTITNRAFKDNKINNDLGREVNLSVVEEWQNLQPVTVIENIDRPLFGYFKVPDANQIDPGSPLGVSVFGRAVDLIRHADEIYSSLLWEYQGGEMAVFADTTTFQEKENGRYDMPKGTERLFRMLDMGEDGAQPVIFAPSLRDSSYIAGLNEALKKIETACGLARGALSDPNQDAKTATELKITKQRSYATVADMQKALEFALNDLFHAIDNLAALYHLTPDGTYEAAFEWDDSIIVDSDIEYQRRLQLMAEGIVSKEEFRAWYFGETIEQARENLPKPAPGIDFGDE